MVCGMARSNPGGYPQRTPFAGTGYNGCAQAYGTLAAGAFGSRTHVYFCPEDKILGRYCCGGNVAVLADRQGNVKTMEQMEIINESLCNPDQRDLR